MAPSSHQVVHLSPRRLLSQTTLKHCTEASSSLSATFAPSELCVGGGVDRDVCVNINKGYEHIIKGIGREIEREREAERDRERQRERERERERE